MSRRPFVFLLVLPALALILPAQIHAQDEAQGTLKLETYLDWEWVSNPQISPDGQRIIYTRSWVDKMKDRRTSSLWMMNADGSRNRFLVDGSGALWSPDGTRIAYVAEGDDGSSEVWVRWMDDEGAATQISRLDKSPGSLRWAPDGTQLAFTMSVPDNDSWRSLVKHAAYVLNDLDPNPDRLRVLLAAFVEETLSEGNGGALLEGLRKPRLIASGKGRGA